MKILALPRDAGSPYQELLYAQMSARGGGVESAYAGELTRSRLANMLLLPLELIVRRGLGWKVLHIHWVYSFHLAGANRYPLLRRVAQACFVLLLITARLLGMRVVWTAHNVLPHERVFHDDVAARRLLVRASDLVMVHSHAALAALDEIGARPRRSLVVPHGPYEPAGNPGRLRSPGSGNGPRRLLLFGLVRSYKGVEELLSVIAGLDDDMPVCVEIAGECDDPELRRRLEAQAQEAGERVILRLGWLPVEEITQRIAACDAGIFPYRKATTSGSAMLVLAHGRPIIVPRLLAFDDMPDEAVIRYDGSQSDLARAIRDVVYATPEKLASSGAAARAYVDGISWGEMADRLLGALAES